jgi:hypothetical protein
VAASIVFSKISGALQAAPLQVYRLQAFARYSASEPSVPVNPCCNDSRPSSKVLRSDSVAERGTVRSLGPRYVVIERLAPSIWSVKRFADG